MLTLSTPRLVSGISWPSLDTILDITQSHILNGMTHSLVSSLVIRWVVSGSDGGSTHTTCTMSFATVSNMTLIFSTCRSSLLQTTSSMQESSRRAVATMKKRTGSGQVSTKSTFRLTSSLVSLSATSITFSTQSWRSLASIFTFKAGFLHSMRSITTRGLRSATRRWSWSPSPRFLFGSVFWSARYHFTKEASGYCCLMPLPESCMSRFASAILPWTFIMDMRTTTPPTNGSKCNAIQQ